MPGSTSPARAVTVLRPDGSRWAQVRLAGPIDARARFALAEALDELTAGPVTSVFVDVAAVTSADEILPNFVVVLRFLAPHMSVAVCRPRPPVRRILEAAGVDRVSTLRDDLPLLDVPSPPG